MDEIDFASERAESFNAMALQMVLQKLDMTRSTGVCRACNMPIEADRLQANPHARHCCDCAEEEEARNNRVKRCGPR